MKARSIISIILLVLLSASHISETTGTPTWWDTAWHFRFGANVNMSQYSRANWPIELDVNFTDLIKQNGKSGTFDINSTRVIEHNSTGGVMYEIPSQFDKAGNYAALGNAIGTVSFLLNGSNAANSMRYFFVYFDVIDNGEKPQPSYPQTANYSWDGEEFTVNTSYFRWRADTIRGENTSGIYYLRSRIGNNLFVTASGASKTKEYTQFSNGSTKLMFDFRNNATFANGPIRLIVEQRGDEAYWNDPSNKTGEGFIVKKYIFYGNTTWIRIDQNYTNLGGAGINRTSSAGAVSLNELDSAEFLGAFYNNGGNATNPFSWFGASTLSGPPGFTLVAENQTGTSNYFAMHNSTDKKIGLALNSTTIPSGQSIISRTAINFTDTTSESTFSSSFRDPIANPPKVFLQPLEEIVFTVGAISNYSIYSRGESALVFGNITSDPYSQSYAVNATLDMGTAGTGDDQTIILYDDGAHGDGAPGDKLFANYFNLTPENQTGLWNFTVRAYDSAYMLLNSSTAVFNLSARYGVTTAVENPMGLAGRVVFATINVTNIRNDTYIPQAAMNCTYGAGPLANITDFGNGTYRLNFTASSDPGTYYLNCSAEKLNNSGWGTSVFYSEAATTYMNTTTMPLSYNASNITWYAFENFTLTINSTNTGNATARSTNYSISLPANISSDAAFSQCGDVPMETSCIKAFNITIANQTAPATYFINITTRWRNADATLGEANSTFNVTVLPNPKIDVPQAIISGTVGDGMNLEAGTFNVTSFGNKNATSVTFSAAGLPAFIVAFTPASISTIAPNTTSIIRVNVSVPAEYAPGNYVGSINASSTDGGWDNLTINITVPKNTTVSVSKSPATYNASNITWYASENFTLTINSTNTGSAPARYANITLYLPPAASGPSYYVCGNISVLASCIKAFNITIANQTAPATYFINITTRWRNADATLGEANSTFNVTVLPNPKIDVPQAIISGTVGDGQNLEVGTFNVTSFGNTNASNITFAVSGLSPISVIFVPVNISGIAPNTTQFVAVNVSVPPMYAAGNYTGTVNASAKNDGWDTFTLNISIPETRSWSRSTTQSESWCIGVEIANAGPVCSIQIQNTGNSPVNISIAPPSANYTLLNETNFTLAYNATRSVLVSYNLSGGEKGSYNTTYIIYSATPNTTPENSSVDIFLFPYIEPTIVPSLSSASVGQNSTVELFVNVTDRSGAGINWSYANVTTPTGDIFTSWNMTYLGILGNVTMWKTIYPSNFSDTNQTRNLSPGSNSRGLYNISIASADNSPAIGFAYSGFLVHRNVSVYVGTPYARYPEGDAQCTDGEMNYSAKYFGDIPASGANVSFGIFSVGTGAWFRYPSTYVTFPDGRVYDAYGQMPAFRICAAQAGKYALVSNFTFYDDVSNETVSFPANASFEVYSRPLTVELVNPTFENTYLAYRIWVKDIFGANIAPDNMTINLFRDFFLSNGSVSSILDTSFSMSDSRVRRENTSIGPKYIVSLSGLSTSTTYWSQVNATYGGRIGLAEKTFNPGLRTWYDIILNLLDYQTYPGDYVDFELTIDNKAGGGQDVYVDYWVANAGLEAKSWYSASMHVFVEQSKTVILPLRAYIFPTQPYGLYWLYVNVTPSNDTSDFSWQAHSAFSVVQKPLIEPPRPPSPPPTTITVPTGGAVTTPPADSDTLKTVSITRYPRNISTVRGWSDISTIEVKNTGALKISNLTLRFTGVPASWYSFKPNNTRSLSEADTAAYLLEFKIPNDANLGTYDVIITAKADEVSDEKIARLNIFASVSEMLRAEINELKLRLQGLESEARFAETAGKNVTLVWPALERARVEISNAELNVANSSYVEAQNHVLISRNYLDRAEFLLASAAYIKVVPSSIIPWWLIVLVIILALLAAFAMLWTFRLKRKVTVLFKSPAILERLVHRFRKETAERQALIFERNRLIRMQDLLDREVKDGTITSSAYDELKKRTSEKLDALDKKMKGQ